MTLWQRVTAPRSRKTVAKTRRAVSQFVEYVGDPPAAEITRTDLIAFRNRLASQGEVNLNTVSEHLSKLRMLFKLAMREGIVESNPADGLSSFKAVAKLSDRRQPFTAEQVALIFKRLPSEPESGDPNLCTSWLKPWLPHRRGESCWGYGKIETARLGAQCVQWILTRGKDHHIRLIHTRNYVPKQTAFYADWLLFREDELASQFLTAFPRFQIPHRLQGLERDRQIIATRMEERLQRGGFDIGKHPPEQRRAIAHRFIELDDKLRDIDEHCRALELAEQLSLEWTTLLGKCHGSSLLNNANMPLNTIAEDIALIRE